MPAIRLTDPQVVLLCWDRRPCRKRGRGWREYDVPPEDLRDALTIAETLSWGSDCTAAAKSLVRKLERLLLP